MFEQNTEKKDIVGILMKYLKYWYLFALCAIVALVIAFVYLRYTTPMYAANTSLLLKGVKSGGGLSESAAFSDIELMNSGRSIDNEILILKSFSLMEKVVRKMELYVTFWIEGQVRDVEIYKADAPFRIIVSDYSPDFYGKSFVVYFKDDNSFEIEDDVLTTEKFGQEIVKPYGKFTIVSETDVALSEQNKPVTVRFHDPLQLAHGLAARLNVYSINANASALMIGISDAVPNKAKDLLTVLIEVYEEVTVDDKNKIAEKTVEFIDDRLTFLTEELNRVEMNVEQYKQEHELTDVGSQAQEFVQAASSNRKELEAINIQLEVLNSIELYLQGQAGGNYELVPSTLTIQDATLNGLIAKFNELQLDRERMLRTTLPNNPIIININDQLNNLRDNILENLKNIKNSLVITRRNLMAKSGMVGSQIQMVPVIERQLIEITRQQEIKQALYLYLLQKKEESSLSLAASVSNSRIIDPPIVRGQISPNKTNIMAYSLLLGLFVPFLGLYLKNLLTNKIESRKDVEKLTNVPILGEICHDKSGEVVVTQVNERTPISEMFRLLRTNLRFSTGGAENKVILITSSMKGEGKTFFTINMGSSLSGAGHKVLIIEFDLRRPMLLKHLKLEQKKGVTDYIVGDVKDYESVIFPSGVNDNLDIMSAGTLPPNPAELILNERVANLIAAMRAKYDYVLLDCPPVGKVADALTLNEYIDSAVYLVRYNYTEKDQLKIIDDIFVGKMLKNPLIVLNDSSKYNVGSYTYGY